MPFDTTLWVCLMAGFCLGEACRGRLRRLRGSVPNPRVRRHVAREDACGFRDFEYFALKVKGLLPGKENSAWKELDGLKMVRHDLSIVATVYVPLPKTKACINDCQALQSA